MFLTMLSYERPAAEGVTLLEVMLVLSIAAMIIMMSVRYYQSANQAQQVNAFIEQVQGVTATVESYAMGGGYLSATQTAITPLLPRNAFVTPWGATMGYSPVSDGYTLSISPVPAPAVCSLIQMRLQSDTHYVVPSNCSSVAYNTTR